MQDTVQRHNYILGLNCRNGLLYEIVVNVQSNCRICLVELSNLRKLKGTKRLATHHKNQEPDKNNKKILRI